MKTRDEVAAAFNAASGAQGFAKFPGQDAAIDSLHAFQSAAFDPTALLNLVQTLLPFFQKNLPALLDLLSTFAPPQFAPILAIIKLFLVPATA